MLYKRLIPLVFRLKGQISKEKGGSQKLKDFLNKKMNKDISIKDFIRMKSKKLFKKKKREELTTDELIKYKKLRKNPIYLPITILGYLFIGSWIIGFWLALTNIVMKAGFGLDFTAPFLLLWNLIAKVWSQIFSIFLLCFIIMIFITYYQSSKHNKWIQEKIIRERK